MITKSTLKALAAGAAMSLALYPATASSWSLEEAAECYADTTIDAAFLLRSGYETVKQMIPEFEEKPGITVNLTEVPYENAQGELVRDFVGCGDLGIAPVIILALIASKQFVRGPTMGAVK